MARGNPPGFSERTDMILIENREMIFLNRENYIGTTFDNNSTVRQFKVKRQSIDGVDIASLLFDLQIRYEDTDTSDTMTLEKEEHPDYILLTWTVPASVSSHQGANRIGIKGYEINGALKWSTYPAFVFVEDFPDHPEPSDEELTIIEQLRAKLAQYEAGYDATVEATQNAVLATGEAKRAASDADTAAGTANNLVEEIEDKLRKGELTGPEGPQGPKGERGPQGESGVMAQSSGMFSLYLDPATGDLYADYPDEDHPPQFEYESSTGNLYYITPEPEGE